MKHVVWDWNGTLYDDISIVLDSTNVAIARFGRAPVDLAEYQANFERPMIGHYSKLLERPLTSTEMDEITLAFHDEYSMRKHDVGLAADSIDALEAISRAGCTQSLLSMWVRSELVPLVNELGLSDYFIYIEGQPMATQLGKTEALGRHLQSLRNDHGVDCSPTEIVVIGDTVDDGRAATKAGVSCRLVSTGSDSHERLIAEPWPVFSSITAALADVLP